MYLGNGPTFLLFKFSVPIWGYPKIDYAIQWKTVDPESTILQQWLLFAKTAQGNAKHEQVNNKPQCPQR